MLNGIANFPKHKTKVTCSNVLIRPVLGSREKYTTFFSLLLQAWCFLSVLSLKSFFESNHLNTKISAGTKAKILPKLIIHLSSLGSNN